MATVALRPRRAGAGDEWVPSFPDGIKSGDPRPGTACLWTRIAPPPDGRDVEVMWSVADDAEMQQVVRGGLTTVGAGDGYAVKVSVRRLAPDRWYYYRFESEGVASVTGRLRTAPRPGATPDRQTFTRRAISSPIGMISRHR